VDLFPDAEELDRVAVAKPLGDEKLAILGLEQVGAGDGPGLGIEFLPVEEYLGLESGVGGGLFRD